MPNTALDTSFSIPLHRYGPYLDDAGLVFARTCAHDLRVSVAYFYADSDLLAEAILAFGLLTEPERRQALRDMKAKLGYDPDDDGGGSKRGRVGKAR
ncbi:hypothetical protein ASD53_12005 [Lysobacter sp. Root559]|uniref:hypothetical protein n=1 Tax=Lysobacter sp. Root559 TaxID=1736559 RepID=UPI0006FC6F12|nr:hypothetical protein [Lysobacter sp. Root559]KQZ57184.1 hypothetical protein ASD53_12005 [Lysobacter sp. Root559]